MPGLQPTTLTLTMAGSVSDFTPAVLAAVKSSLAQASGVPESSIGLTVQAGSVVLAVSMPSSGAATVRSLIQSGTLPQLGGRTVESVVLSSTQVARTVAPYATSPSLSPMAPSGPRAQRSCWARFERICRERTDDGRSHSSALLLCLLDRR